MAEGLPTLRKYKLNGIAERLGKMAPGGAEPVAEATEEETAFVTEPLKSAEEIAAFLRSIQGQPAALHVTPTRMTVAGPGRLGEIQLQQDMLSEGLLPDEAWQALKPLLSEKICVHDGKSLLHQLGDMGVPLPEFAWDTMLGAYLHNPQEKSYALPQFAREDAAGVLTLAEKQKKLLEQEGMTALMRDVEMPLLYVLFDMEQAGFQVDGKVLSELGKEFTQQAEELKEEVYKLTGVSGFNLNSTQQLGKVLFETLDLPHGKKTTRGYSTDAETLEKLADLHPCISPILKYRQVMKLNSTYIDALLRYFEDCGCEALVLGCTHFPYLTAVLGAYTGLTLLDPAEEMVRILCQKEGETC